MRKLKELARELDNALNLGGLAGKAYKVEIFSDKIRVKYFDSGIGKDEIKLLTYQEADNMINALY